jgi:deoxyguanosine kinase
MAGNPRARHRPAVPAGRRAPAGLTPARGLLYVENMAVSPPLDPSIRFIGIEGVIGVGKTSLARRIVEAVGGHLHLEQHEENPFLRSFYGDMNAYAFQTQLFFLLERYRQQKELRQQDLFRRLVVSDYLFAKDRIFAHVTLNEQELALYDKIHDLLKAEVQKPDLVVFLQGNLDVIMGRIQGRGRNYEREITREYLAALAEAYNYFFFHYDESPLLVVNTDHLDFMENEEHFQDLMRRIGERFEGTQYYVPSWD